MSKNKSIRPMENSVTIFYDGACPICSREIDSIEHYVQKKKRECVTSSGRAESIGDNSVLNFVDVHQVDSMLIELPQNKATLLHDLHVQFDDGAILVGIDANLFLWRHGPYPWLASIISQPVIYHCAKYVYSLWSKRRYAKLYSEGVSKSGATTL